MTQDKIKFIRNMGPFSLTMTGISSMIGSGWLFSSYYAAKLAGPAAIFSWIIGGLAALLIALTICEVSSLLPKAGGMARFMDYTHGSLSGFFSAWANWLGTVAVIPIEAEASIQYMSGWKWDWAQNLYNPSNHQLTLTGTVGAIILIIFYFLINYWSLKLFIRSMSAITIFKIVVPILTGVMILYSGFHPDNFTYIAHSFVPYGWSSVLTAVVTCGIVMSFNGFQSPINMAAEAIKSRISLPIAVILGLLFTLVVYLLLQIAFIGAIPTEMLQKAGWHGISFNSPLAQLAMLFNLNLIVLLLYFDSFVSPSGTGIVYTATTSRMLYGMQRNGYMPDFLGYLNPTYHIPRAALVVNLLVSFIFLFCFRGWAHLVAIISAAHIVSYIPGPISLEALRRLVPKAERAFRLRLAGFFSPVAFVVITFLFYWAKWPLTGQVILSLMLSLVFYFYYQRKHSWIDLKSHFQASVWLLFYFAGICLLSYEGSREFGGVDRFSLINTHVLLAVLALISYYWARQSAWKTPLLSKTLLGSQ